MRFVVSRDQDALPSESPQAASLGAILLGPGQPAERLCSYLIAGEKQFVSSEEPKQAIESGGAEADPVIPWTVARLHVVDTLGVMCGVSNEAIRAIVATGAVPCLLGVLR